MKKYYILLCFLCINIYAKSTNIQSDSIKYAVVSFLIKEEKDLPMSILSGLHDFSNDRIRNVKTNEPLDPNAEGIYVFWSTSEHSFNHILLIEKNDFQIINMREKMETSLSQFVLFLKRKDYSKDDVIFYLEQFIYFSNLNSNGGWLWK